MPVCCNVKAMSTYVKPSLFRSLYPVIRHNSVLQISVVWRMKCNSGKTFMWKFIVLPIFSPWHLFSMSSLSKRNMGGEVATGGNVIYLKYFTPIAPQEDCGGHFLNLIISQATLLSAVCFNLPQASGWERKHCLSSLFFQNQYLDNRDELHILQ